MKKSIPTGVAYGRSLALEAAGFNVWREQTRLETHTGVADWSREIAFALANCGDEPNVNFLLRVARNVLHL